MEKDIFDQIFYSEEKPFFECGKYTVEELTYLYNLNEPKILILIKNVFRIIGAAILIGLCILMLINISKPIDVTPVETGPIGNQQQEIVTPPVNKPVEQPITEEPIPDTDVQYPIVEDVNNSSSSSTSILDFLSVPIEFILDVIPEFFNLLAKIGDYIDFDKVFYDIRNIKTLITDPFSNESREIIKEYRAEIRLRIIEQITTNQEISEEKKDELINFVNETFSTRDKIENYIFNIINRESIVI